MSRAKTSSHVAVGYVSVKAKSPHRQLADVPCERDPAGRKVQYVLSPKNKFRPGPTHLVVLVDCGLAGESVASCRPGFAQMISSSIRTTAQIGRALYQDALVWTRHDLELGLVLAVVVPLGTLGGSALRGTAWHRL